MCELIPVSSSNIEAIGFDNGTLTVQFLNGSLYEYKNVPNELFDMFLRATSKGKFFQDNIRSSFDYKKVN